ncbi:MAG: hypothetical protein ACU843_15725 [Gammaproteobacteria bacterium]
MSKQVNRHSLIGRLNQIGLPRCKLQPGDASRASSVWQLLAFGNHVMRWLRSSFTLPVIVTVFAFGQAVDAKAAEAERTEFVVDFLPKIRLEVALSADPGAELQFIVQTKRESSEIGALPADCREVPVRLVVSKLATVENLANTPSDSEQNTIAGPPVISELGPDSVLADLVLERGQSLRQSIVNYSAVRMPLVLGLLIKSGTEECFSAALVQVFNAAGDTVSLSRFEGAFRVTEVRHAIQ